MVDRDRVQFRLELLAGYRDELRRLRDLGLDAYLREAYAGRYLVQVAAQTCIDLAGHVIASNGWRAPRSFADGFTVLCEHGVLDADLADRLRALAGLRNRLVHVYDEVDDERVHAALRDGLDDIETFAVAITRLVAGRAQGDRQGRRH
ncbi:MAG: type VII toxin-antitoxin system HepT family RNase toxin [Pseudonocardia sp.]